MSKEYIFFCTKHGQLHIEVEKPPLISRNVYCPWCAQKLLRTIKEAEKELQLNYSLKGVNA